MGRRVDIELVADGLVGGALLYLDLARDLLVQFGEHAGVYGDAVRLHASQHGHERHRVFVVVGREPVPLHVLCKGVLQLERHGGGGRGVLGGVRNGHGIERYLLPARAGQVCQRLQLDVEPVESQGLEPERLLAGEMRREHRVERDIHRGRQQTVVE